MTRINVAPEPTQDCAGGCGKEVPFTMWACPACWGRVPKELRDRCNRTWRVDPEAHDAAQDEVADWCRRNPIQAAQAVRASDLPEGSVVAYSRIAWIKGTFGWQVTGGKDLDINRPDSDVDQALTNGAQVLRVGTGQEGS